MKGEGRENKNATSRMLSLNPEISKNGNRSIPIENLKIQKMDLAKSVMNMAFDGATFIFQPSHFVVGQVGR